MNWKLIYWPTEKIAELMEIIFLLLYSIFFHPSIEQLFALLSMLASVTQALHAPLVSHSSLYHPLSDSKAVASSVVFER